VRIRCQVHLEVFSAIAFADELLVLDLLRRLTGHRLLPVADTEAGCPQSLGREAGILAGVLQTTACDPSKSKPARARLRSRAHGPNFHAFAAFPQGIQGTT
jgi:hypothetical protein